MARQLSEVSGYFSPIEAIETLSLFNGALNSAQLFMDRNRIIYTRFKIMDLTDPVQAHKKDAIKEFIAAELLSGKFQHNPRNKPLEAALEIANRQSLSHFAKVDAQCADAPELRLQVGTLFNMIRSKPEGILPFNPAMPIDRGILRDWVGSFE